MENRGGEIPQNEGWQVVKEDGEEGRSQNLRTDHRETFLKAGVVVDIEEESKKRMVEEESGGVWVPGTNESESYNEVLSLNDCTHGTYFHF